LRPARLPVRRGVHQEAWLADARATCQDSTPSLVQDANGDRAVSALGYILASMTFDAFLHQLPDADAAETGEWLESSIRWLLEVPFVPVSSSHCWSAPTLQVPVPSLSRRVHQHDSPTRSVFPGDEEMERRPPYRPLECPRWSPGQIKRSDGIGVICRQYRRPASLSEVGSTTSFLDQDGQLRRPDLLPGHARRGCTRTHTSRSDHRGADDNFRQETGATVSLVSASALDARLLGSSPRFPWALGPLTRSTRHGSTATSTTAISPTPARAASGVSSRRRVRTNRRARALSLAAREQLDNLTFVVNCNLQRLDDRCAATAR